MIMTPVFSGLLDYGIGTIQVLSGSRTCRKAARSSLRSEIPSAEKRLDVIFLVLLSYTAYNHA